MNDGNLEKNFEILHNVFPLSKCCTYWYVIQSLGETHSMNNISVHKIAPRFQDYLVRFSTCTETLLNYINSIINSKFKFSNESNVDDCLAPADTRIFLSVFSFSLFFHSLCRSFVIFNLLCRFLSILNFVVD